MIEYVILGTSHLIQESNEFEQAVTDLCGKHQIAVLAEENTYDISSTAARRVSMRLRIPYIQIDPCAREWVEHGIDREMSVRGQFQGEQDVRLSHADEVREENWLNRIEASADGQRVLLVCGYLHVDFIAQKVKARACTLVEKSTFPASLLGRKPDMVLGPDDLDENIRTGCKAGSENQ